MTKTAYVVLSKGDLLAMLSTFAENDDNSRCRVIRNITLRDEVDCFQISSTDLIVNCGESLTIKENEIE